MAGTIGFQQVMQPWQPRDSQQNLVFSRAMMSAMCGTADSRHPDAFSTGPRAAFVAWPALSHNAALYCTCCSS